MKFLHGFIFWASVTLVGSALGQDILIDDGDTKYLYQSTDYGTSRLILGVDTSGNGLRIYDNVTVLAGSTFVGFSSASSNNWLEIEEQAYLQADGFLVVGGHDSSGNSLDLAKGAIAVSAIGIVGDTEDANGNDVMIAGTGSTWQVLNNLDIGRSGSGNSLRILDDAGVWAESLWVGVHESASSNSVQVSDSKLMVTASVVVGAEGSNNRMDITDGAEVATGYAWVGAADSADSNMVYISGTGSVWTNSGMYIGTTNNSGNLVVVSDHAEIVAYNGLTINGSGNSFNINTNGRLTVYSDLDASMSGFNLNKGGQLYVGGTLAGMSGGIEDGRTLGIFGTNGQWIPTGTIEVGGTSRDNALHIEEGGHVAATNLFVGSGGTSSNNSVWVTGAGSLLSIADALKIGATSNANNSVSVSQGGKITVGGGFAIEGSNNVFNLSDGGWLVAHNHFDASLAGFNFQEGGTLETAGTLTGMDHSIEDGRSLLLTGSNAAWNLGTNTLQLGGNTSSNTLFLSGGAQLASTNAVVGGTSGADHNQISIKDSGSAWINSGSLLVGHGGNSNTLSIIDGGRVDSLSAMIGSGAGGTGNWVRVSGTGSLWMNGGNLTLGDSGWGNRLVVSDGGTVDVGQTLSMKNQSLLAFSSGGHVSASNYYQDASSTISFNSMTNLAVDPVTELLAVSDTAEFESGASLEYIGTIDELAVRTVYTNLLVSSDTLIVGGVTNATGADLYELSSKGYGSLLAIEFFALNDDLYVEIMRARLADIAGFDEGTDMAAVCDEIDQLAYDGNSAAINQLGILTELDGSTQNSQLAQLYDRSAPTYAHMGGMLEGFRLTRQRGVMPDSMWPIESVEPVGAHGPHFYGDQIQGWIEGHGSWGDRDGSSGFSSYDHSIYGMVAGIDKSFGNLLAGLAGGYATSEIRQEDGDNSKAGTGYGLLYASWGTTDWFGDLNLGYGHSSIEENSGTLFDTTAKFDANQLAFYTGGGKEFIFRNDQLFLTPSVGLRGSYYSQENYTEHASTAVARKVDAYDRWSMQSELGLTASFQRKYNRIVLMPETHASWLHEFNSDEERVGYSLVDGSGHYTFGMQAPVEDLFEAGVGLSLWNKTKSGIVHEWSMGFDARFGNGYFASALNARFLFKF